MFLGELDESSESALASVEMILDQCRAETDGYRNFESTIYETLSSGERILIPSYAPLPSGCDWAALSRYHPAASYLITRGLFSNVKLAYLSVKDSFPESPFQL